MTCKHQGEMDGIEQNIGYNDGYARRSKHDKLAGNDRYEFGYRTGNQDRSDDDVARVVA